jgi:hypothetical protein
MVAECRLKYRPSWAVLVGLGFLNAALPMTPAAAQPTQQQQSAIRSNCRSDYMSNCSSVKPGGIEALQCLQRNVAKLSPGCQSAVNALSPPPAPPQQATAPAAAPASQPPAAAKPAQVAPAAQSARAMPGATSATAAGAATPSAPAPAPQQPVRAATAPVTAAPARPTSQQQAAIRQSCQSDFMSRCRGVQPGGADALHCLQRNSAQLSPSCQRAVAALGGPAPAGAAPAVATAAPAAPVLASAPTPDQQNAIKLTCRRDFMTNCRGVTPGGPEALACLQRSTARLSPDCKTSLAAVAGGAPEPAATTAAPATAPGARPGPVGPVRRAIRDRLMKE